MTLWQTRPRCPGLSLVWDDALQVSVTVRQYSSPWVSVVGVIRPLSIRYQGALEEQATLKRVSGGHDAAVIISLGDARPQLPRESRRGDSARPVRWADLAVELYD